MLDLGDVGRPGSSARARARRYRVGTRPRVSYDLGADGEETVARSLGPTVDALGGIFLHDLSIPGQNANIDHVVLVRSGVYVIDAKLWTGRIEIVAEGVLDARREHLRVRGRDQSAKVRKLCDQVEWVRAALANDPLVSDVHGMMCFVDGDFRTQAKTVDEMRVTTPAAARRHLGAAGPHDRAALVRGARCLLQELPPRP